MLSSSKERNLYEMYEQVISPQLCSISMPSYPSVVSPFLASAFLIQLRNRLWHGSLNKQRRRVHRPSGASLVHGTNFLWEHPNPMPPF